MNRVYMARGAECAVSGEDYSSLRSWLAHYILNGKRVLFSIPSKVYSHNAMFRRKNAEVLWKQLTMVDFQSRLADIVDRKDLFVPNVMRLDKGSQALEIPILATVQVPDKLGLLYRN